MTIETTDLDSEVNVKSCTVKFAKIVCDNRLEPEFDEPVTKT